MKRALCVLRVCALLTLACAAAPATAAQSAKPYEPVVGQAGRDVIWVPTPYVLVEHMLDVARVTPRDFVVDLGSGDGRNVIAAAKRGARALGVEYNPQMVSLSRRIAAKEGVAERARFVQGDMYEADISKATVLALFLLPENLRRLTPRFVNLRPGARIVTNGYEIPGWSPDRTSRAQGDCGSWCTAYLYIVPAKVAGTWQLREGTLTLEQHFQYVTGTLESNGTSTPISGGRLQGNRIRLSVDGREYAGRVQGGTIVGRIVGGAGGSFRAERVQPRA